MSKVKWNTAIKQERVVTDSDSKSGFTINSLKVGHNRSEFFIGLGEQVIIFPAQTALRLKHDLSSVIEEWEQAHGKIIDLPSKRKRRRESVPMKVLKNLYKSRKPSAKVISINTRRKKNHPSGRK